MAKRTKLVALSGGIGTGKSTVARIFEKLGAAVVDADAIVHELQAPGQPMLRELAEAFGPEIMDASGALDRKALADVVFRDEEARRRLNAIVHPQVGVEFARRVAAARESRAALIVLDIPLLFENRGRGGGGASQWDFDATVLVYAPEPVQVARTVARDGCSAEQARDRVRAQLPIEEKRALADHVIDNSGTVEETERQVRALFEALRD